MANLPRIEVPHVDYGSEEGAISRASVFGVTSGGVYNPVAEYGEARIRERSRLILYATDARKQRFPRETSYRCVPLAGQEARSRWTSAAKADIKDHNLLDLGI